MGAFAVILNYSEVKGTNISDGCVFHIIYIILSFDHLLEILTQEQIQAMKNIVNECAIKEQAT